MPPIVTFSEAAAALGYRSRSQLYALKRDGFLKQYLVPGMGRSGADEIDLQPDGQPHLREHLKGILQLRVGNVSRRRRPAAPAPEPPSAWLGTQSFWEEFGDWRPDEQLDDPEWHRQLSLMLSAMLGATTVELTPGNTVELAWQLDELRADLRAGARWDEQAWAAATARLEAEDSAV